MYTFGQTTCSEVYKDLDLDEAEAEDDNLNCLRLMSDGLGGLATTCSAMWRKQSTTCFREILEKQG